MNGHVVFQLSDPHLSRDRGYTAAGWEACLRHVAQARPDFVVATGDQVMDDPDDAADQQHARATLDRLAIPWAAIPGNHDIGDSGPAPHMGQDVTPARMERWQRLYGPDRWVRDLGAWRLIGLNAQLPGSALTGAAQAQQDWLEQTLRAAPERPAMVFLHKPLCFFDHGETAASEYLLDPAGRDALATLLRAGTVRLVASGHAHCARVAWPGGVPHVWAPSATLLGGGGADVPGDSQPGMVRYELGADGDVRFDFVRPLELVAFDPVPLKRLHGAMRFAPPLAGAVVAGA